MKINIWIENAIFKLRNVSKNARLEAELILSYILQRNRSWIIAYQETILTLPHITRLQYLIKRRMNGVPISYLIKEREFWSLNLKINSHSFIPRHDSELLVETTLFYLSSLPAQILDLGTGCGALALAIAKERPDCFIVGVDYFKKLINLSKYNAKKLKIFNVKFIQSDWFSKLKNEIFDIIISNPPYLSKKDFYLNSEIHFEPVKALISKENGLADIKNIIKNSKKFLKKNGWLLFEHGWNQGNKIRKILEKYHFSNIITYQDYSNLERVSVAMIKK